MLSDWIIHKCVNCDREFAISRYDRSPYCCPHCTAKTGLHVVGNGTMEEKRYEE